MKKIFVLLSLGIFCVIFLSGCTMDFAEKTINNVDDKQGEVINLKFDLDINLLAYKLPDYTKKCTPSKKYYCNKTSCSEVKQTVFILIDEKNSLIYRCDNNPCDKYEYTAEKSGIYNNIRPNKNNGLIYKISDSGEYTEIATSGNDAYMSFGICK